MIILRRTRPGVEIRLAETLIGTQDSNNQVFETPTKYKSSRISVLYNGQALHSPEDFIESGDAEVTFIYIKPHVDDVLRVTYEADPT